MEVEMLERKTGGIGYLTGEWPMDPEKSTLVFIHGVGGHGYFWQAQMEALSDRANMVALDLPGHGRSDGSGKESIAEYAQAVSEFLADIGAPNPVPCGFSLGGAIAQQLLMDFPQLYSAGILIGTGGRMKVGPIIFEAIENDFSEFVEMLGKLAASKKTDPEKIRFFKDELSKSNPQVVSGDFRACDRFAAGAGLVSIEVPVLIITAEDDILTPAKLGEVLVNKIQNTQHAHILDAGHLMVLEKPGEINSAIAEFIDKRDC
jgi:pimeloyl-ACP methyl ester carboxylesterase